MIKLNSNLNIFVSCNSNFYIPKSNYLFPIRVGATNKSIDNIKTLRDDSGDNISNLNPYYCELTAQYWAWKNVDSEYYGFFHYRRFLSFSDFKFSGEDSFKFSYLPVLNKKALFDLGYSNDIFEEVKKYDLIVPQLVDLKAAGHKSVYGHYNDSRLNISDLNLLLNIIKKSSPKYYESAKEYLNGQYGLFCNIFVMKKDLFDEYSSWLFAILDEFYKKADMSNYNKESLRTPGHLGERMLGIFYTYLKNNTKAKIGFKKLVVFNKVSNFSDFADIKPAYSISNVPFVMSINDTFAPYACAALRSIIDSALKNKNYDVIVISNNLSNYSKRMINKIFVNVENFSIRYIDPSSFIDGYNLNERTNITIETYYRLLIPELINYDKILYLDSDIIVKKDVADLFNIDIGDNLVGGVVDVAHASTINSKYLDAKKYYSQFKVKNLYNFINAGVLILNSKKIREGFSTEYLLMFAQQNAFRFQDQDLINVLFEGKIKYISSEWNFYADSLDSPRGKMNAYAPKSIYENWLKAGSNPKIIHYAGNEKPWLYPMLEYSNEFWENFLRTPFYWSYMFNDLSFKKNNVIVASNKPSFIKRTADKLLPCNSRRRLFIKKICRKLGPRFFPANTKRRYRLKKWLIKNGFNNAWH